MAHHVAELIHRAERARTPAERSTAKKDATETILRIWERRKSLPGRAYPLAPYEDLLRVIDRLRPDDNPFRYGGSHETRKDQLAAELFDGLSRLTIALLLGSIPSGARSVRTDAAVVDSLSKSEQRVLMALNHWADLFVPKSARRRSAKSNKGGRTRKVDLDEVVRRLISQMTTTLAKLGDAFQKDG